MKPVMNGRSRTSAVRMNYTLHISRNHPNALFKSKIQMSGSTISYIRDKETATIVRRTFKLESRQASFGQILVELLLENLDPPNEVDSAKVCGHETCLQFRFSLANTISSLSALKLLKEMSFFESLSTAQADTDVPSPLPALPKNRIVVGCGMICMDYLATVAAYPKPDDKIRCTNVMVQGGGNVGNALTCAARLGLTPRLISKVADDAHGRSVLKELEADGVDISYVVVSEKGNSQFSYVIVDNQMKTRTCIFTRLSPPLLPSDISQSRLFSSLDGARLAYFDGRKLKTALVVAKEAVSMQIPVLVEAERKKNGLDDLLDLADYIVCSARFPLAWTMASSVPSALASILLRLPRAKFVIVTLGENGSLMLERAENEDPDLEETDVDSFLESMKERINDGDATPKCISTKSTMRLKAAGIGTVCGRLLVGTAEKIPPSELVDTTGAGDAFIGAVLYAISAGMSPEKMLPFAAQVAAAGCKALGARTGLPRRDYQSLAPFLC